MARTKEAVREKKKRPRQILIESRRKPLPTSNQNAGSQAPLVPLRVNTIISKTNTNQRVHKPLTINTSRFAELMIPKRVFQRICKEIAYEKLLGCRFKVDALLALQKAAEDFMIGFFEDAAMCVAHAKRKTLMVKDFELVARLRRINYKPL